MLNSTSNLFFTTKWRIERVLSLSVVILTKTQISVSLETTFSISKENPGKVLSNFPKKLIAKNQTLYTSLMKHEFQFLWLYNLYRQFLITLLYPLDQMMRILPVQFLRHSLQPPINIAKAYYCSWLKNNKFFIH